LQSFCCFYNILNIFFKKENFMKHLSVIKKSPLFQGIGEKEIEVMLNCLSGVQKSYRKLEYVQRAGDRVTSFGLVLTGSVLISKEDFWGNRSILSEVGPCESFGEVYAITGSGILGVSVTASENTDILYLDVRRILTVCTSACEFHSRLIQNLLRLMAQKNRSLTEKIEHMARRTTREKLLSYLSAQAIRQGKASFDISLNREALADYLSVDRSAMSGELSKMRREGILDYQRNHFQLKQMEHLE